MHSCLLLSGCGSRVLPVLGGSVEVVDRPSKKKERSMKTEKEFAWHIYNYRLEESNATCRAITTVSFYVCLWVVWDWPNNIVSFICLVF